MVRHGIWWNKRRGVVPRDLYPRPTCFRYAFVPSSTTFFSFHPSYRCTASFHPVPFLVPNRPVLAMHPREIAVKVPIVVEILCPDVASINMDCTELELIWLLIDSPV